MCNICAGHNRHREVVHKSREAIHFLQEVLFFFNVLFFTVTEYVCSVLDCNNGDHFQIKIQNNIIVETELRTSLKYCTMNIVTEIKKKYNGMYLAV